MMSIRQKASDKLDSPAGLALGTGTDIPVLSELLIEQVIKACPDQSREDLAVAVIALLEELSPQSPVEGMLVAHMVASHFMAMAQLGAAARTKELQNLQIYLQLATKIQRTLLAQVETLNRIRNTQKQRLQVEQVHLHAHQGQQVYLGGENPEKL